MSDAPESSANPENAASASTPKSPTGSPNVALAGGIMMISLLLSRVLGLVRDAIISGMFGVTAETDAYRLAFQVPDLLFFLIAGGALSSAFIPVFTEYLHTDREREAWHVFSVVTTIMSAIVIAFIAFAFVFTEPLVALAAPGKSQALMPLIAHMSRIVLPAQFAFFIGGLMFGTLYARQVFAVPGLGPNIYNIGIILGATVLSGLFSPGVIGMSWGALAGAVIGNLIVPGIVMWKMGAQFKPSFDTKHPGVRKVFKLMLPVVLGLSLPGVYALIMQAFGSYYQDGVNTILEYSNKLMQAPLGIFGQSLAIGVFPALSQFFAQGRMDMYRNQLASTMRTVLYLTIPISVFMAVLALPISAAMYRHGAMSLESTREIAACLQLFAIGIPAWCLHPVLMRAYFAIQNTVTPIVIGTITTAVFFVLALSLRLLPLGYMALPLASSISAIVLVLIMIAAVRGRIGGLDVKSLLATGGKSLVGSIPVAIVAGAVAWTPLSEKIVGGKLTQLATVGLVLMISSVGYFLLTRALGMNESSYVSRVVDRVKGKLKK